MIKFEKISCAQFEKDFCGKANYNDVILPKRATSGSAGYDFFAPFDFTLSSGETVTMPTGIRILLPKDKFLLICPRSGLGFKYRLQLDNTIGIIDSDYSGADNEGHIFIRMTLDSKQNKTLSIRKGEAFAQGIIMQYFVTDDDTAGGIRTGGFGSTSK